MGVVKRLVQWKGCEGFRWQCSTEEIVHAGGGGGEVKKILSLFQ